MRGGRGGVIGCPATRKGKKLKRCMAFTSNGERKRTGGGKEEGGGAIEK